MAQLKLGSRHGKPVKRVTSQVNADNRIDEAKANAAGFFGTDDKPAYFGEAFIPYLAAGDVATKEEALKQIGDLITSLEHAAKADGLVVETADKKIYEGPVLGKLSIKGLDGDRHVLPGATNGMSAAAYVCMLVKDALTLAHQQEMNGILRKQMWADAQAKGLAKAKTASAGRTRSEEVY